MTGYRILACAIGREGLANKQPQSGQRRIGAMSILTDFFGEYLGEMLGGQHLRECLGRAICKLLLKRNNRLL